MARVSFIDDLDDLHSVAQEWGQTDETFATLVILITLALDAGCEGARECRDWAVAAGYATVLSDDAIRITDEGRARALHEAVLYYGEDA